MEHLSWIGLGLLAAIGAAGVAIFGKLGVEQVDTTLAATLRSLVMTAMLCLVVVLSGRPQSLVAQVGQVEAKAWLFIILAGVAGAVSWLAYFAALRIGTATQVAAIDRLSLAFVIVLATLFLGERYGARGWIGVALTLAGIALMATDTPQAGPSDTKNDASVGAPER